MSRAQQHGGERPDAGRRCTPHSPGSHLRERAENNTRALLTGLARSLGVDEVAIRPEDTADGTG